MMLLSGVSNRFANSLPMELIRSASDLDAALDALIAHDPALAPLAARVRPLPLREAQPGFAALARIIIAQQVSARVADVLDGRLNGLVPNLAPAAFLDAGEEVWRQAGLSRPKQRALAATAEAILCGALDLADAAAMSAEDAIQAMTTVKGIGPWTAEVYLLFACGHPDVFPSRDLALQVAVQGHFGWPERPKDRAVAEAARRWAPLRSVSARLMWAVYGLDRGLPPPVA
jgi:DNA-3-methyladenine glycosylase II